MDNMEYFLYEKKDYFITADDSHPEYLIGGFEAAADGAKTVQVTNIEWTTGVMDSNLACEVTIKTRVKG